jgi:hypothetical protein
LEARAKAKADRANDNTNTISKRLFYLRLEQLA